MNGYILRAYFNGKQRSRFTEHSEAAAMLRWHALVGGLDKAYDKITMETWREGKITCAIFCD